MGVLLDPAPLPDLLVKHLALSPGQGVRISNVHRDSPADKAGLDRDDIIIGFQGNDVTDRDTFVAEVRKAGAETEVSLAIIHLGQRQTVKLKLERFTGAVDLKYPPEPDAAQSWRPGKIFRFTPGDKTWEEYFRDNMPKDFDMSIRHFFDEMSTYHHSNGEEYTITIRGNPDDDDLAVIVRTGPAEYKTTAKEIDRLPEEYREAAKQAVENHRRAAKFEIRTPPPSGGWRSYYDRLRSRLSPHSRPFEPQDQALKQMQEQMRQLQERLDKLEKRAPEAGPGLSDGSDKSDRSDRRGIGNSQ
jgi:hypothetical protein